ncbi:MAG TPA: ATP-dependent DNA helicase [Candidatus Limnocylindria bacterium]|nr:ATP-dependent DNA helicase [Candidatus Limnocylindria bacterium]
MVAEKALRSDVGERVRAAVAQPPVSLAAVGELLAGLNREQRRAVTHRDGPQLVVAGPGTGKTEVITRRIAWLVATRRARPSEILALTFTDAAADEMQARVDLLVPYGHAGAAIHTFHALGDRLVREHAFELGLPGDARLINRAEAVVLLRDNLFALGLERYRPLGDPTRFLGALVDLFGRAKEEGVDPRHLADYAARVAERATDPATQDAAGALVEQAAAYAAYQDLLGRHGLIDHGDQLSLAARLLGERPAVRDDVVKRHRYLLVDEFQDMNHAQLELLLALTPNGRNVTVVGDLDQAIYAFRGAASDNVRRLSDAHPDVTRIVLRRNYRSRQPIIDAATRLIDHGPRPHINGADVRQVAARRARNPRPVRLATYATPAEEADGVATAVAAQIASGVAPRDIAVLARSNAEIEPLVRSLNMLGLPVRTRTPADFFAQPEVRPLVAFLRCVADPTVSIELYVLATAWPYNLGGERLTALLADARRAHVPLWDSIVRLAHDATPKGSDVFVAAARRLVTHLRAAIESSHQRSAGEVLYEQLRRTTALARLAASENAAAARSVARFFDLVRSRSMLLADARVAALVPHLNELIDVADPVGDDGPLDLNAVSVLTIHRAKGLQFRVVHLTGLVDGRFPVHSRPPVLSVPWPELHGIPAVSGEDRLSEERRLCYVAMTRAMDDLTLSSHRAGPGSRGRRRPSPFIAEALDLPVEKSVEPLDPARQLVAPPSMTPPTPTIAEMPASSFSFSMLEEYLDCPERYRLRHVVGLPTPPHHALTYGRALHATVAWFHLRVAATGTPTDAELAEEFRRNWLSEGFLSREHEEARFGAGLRALATFRARSLAQPANVVAIERPFEFSLDGMRIRGRFDRLDEDGAGTVIVDYKSSDVRDQRKANEKARNSLQLQTYALAHQQRTSDLPSAVQLHFLESGLVGEAAPEPARLEKAREKLRGAMAGIAVKDFDPRPNPVMCGFCPFRQICPSSAA